MAPPTVRDHYTMLRNVALICIATMLATTITVIIIARVRAQDACENRHAVIEAVDVYTDALETATIRPNQSPEQRKEREVVVAHFREQIAQGLEPLLDGCA